MVGFLVFSLLVGVVYLGTGWCLLATAGFFRGGAEGEGRESDRRLSFSVSIAA